jgi:hypothetical protein
MCSTLKPHILEVFDLYISRQLTGAAIDIRGRTREEIGDVVPSGLVSESMGKVH